MRTHTKLLFIFSKKQTKVLFGFLNITLYERIMHTDKSEQTYCCHFLRKRIRTFINEIFFHFLLRFMKKYWKSQLKHKKPYRAALCHGTPCHATVYSPPPPAYFVWNFPEKKQIQSHTMSVRKKNNLVHLMHNKTYNRTWKNSLSV